MKKLIVSFDPGGTTGYCIFEVIDNKAKLLRYGQFSTFTGLPIIETLIRSYEGEVHVVYEDFILVKVNIDLGAIKSIGAIQYWYASIAQHKTGMRLSKQSPSERTFIEYRFNKPYKHVTDHRRSALLHAMCFMYKQFKITEYAFEERGVEI